MAGLPLLGILVLAGCGKQVAQQSRPSSPPQPALKQAPPTPIAEKKEELGQTSWDPQWDLIVEKALPPEMLSPRVARGVRTYCPRFASMAEADKRAFWAYTFQALAGAEAGLPYRVESTPFKDRGAEHFAHQPFGQAPWLTDGDLSIFESGAILIYLGERSDILLPKDTKGRTEVMTWVFAALNSVEMASLPWFFIGMSPENRTGPGWAFLESFLKLRLDRMEPVLARREWLAGSFSIADILMADVLRTADRLDALADYPAARAYVERATARPAFAKAYADQIVHFAKAD